MEGQREPNPPAGRTAGWLAAKQADPRRIAAYGVLTRGSDPGHAYQNASDSILRESTVRSQIARAASDGIPQNTGLSVLFLMSATRLPEAWLGEAGRLRADPWTA